jgi:hypothetical protein
MQGVSPGLNKAVMDRLRPLKFKVLDGVTEPSAFKGTDSTILPGYAGFSLLLRILRRQRFLAFNIGKHMIDLVAQPPRKLQFAKLRFCARAISGLVAVTTVFVTGAEGGFSYFHVLAHASAAGINSSGPLNAFTSGTFPIHLNLIFYSTPINSEARRVAYTVEPVVSNLVAVERGS